MTNIPHLLTDKDFRILQSAFDHCKEYDISMTLGDYSLSVSVVPAPPVWEQPMLIQVKQSRRCVDETKNCRSIEEVRWYLHMKGEKL